MEPFLGRTLTILAKALKHWWRKIILAIKLFAKRLPYTVQYKWLNLIINCLTLSLSHALLMLCYYNLFTEFSTDTIAPALLSYSIFCIVATYFSSLRTTCMHSCKVAVTFGFTKLPIWELARCTGVHLYVSEVFKHNNAKRYL